MNENIGSGVYLDKLKAWYEDKEKQTVANVVGKLKRYVDHDLNELRIILNQETINVDMARSRVRRIQEYIDRLQVERK